MMAHSAGKEDTLVAQQYITQIGPIGKPLCQGCRHEMTRDEIGTKCDLCIAEEVAGRYADRESKSAVGMEWPDIMNTSDPAEYWYWLNIVDTMLAKPGEPTHLERNVTTVRAIWWAERYEEDSRRLTERYEWLGIRQDMPVAQVIGGKRRIRLTGI